MEARHEGQLVRQHHPNLCIRISSMEGVKYRVQRNGQNDGRTIKCPSVYVSRTHCEIFRKDRAYWVKDVGSSNGTYLNGVKLTPNNERELRFGDILGMGISHEPTDETISPNSPDCYIFKFCQREEDLEVIEIDEEDTQVVTPQKSNDNHSNKKRPDSDEDVMILEEVSAEATNKSSTSDKRSSPSSRKMPPPPPPPIISKPVPSSSSTRKTLPVTKTSSAKVNADNVKSTHSDKQISGHKDENKTDEPSKLPRRTSVDKSGEETLKRPLVTETYERPVKRRKEDSSSSDDSSDGLGDVDINSVFKKGNSHLPQSYSGVSSDESSSDEKIDKVERTWVNIPTKKQDKEDRSPKLSSSKLKPPHSTSKLSVDKNQNVPRNNEDYETVSRRKYEELKAEAEHSVCKVKLQQVIVRNNETGAYTLTKPVYDALDPISKRNMQEQFRLSLANHKQSMSNSLVCTNMSKLQTEPARLPSRENSTENMVSPPSNSIKGLNSRKPENDKLASPFVHLCNENPQDFKDPEVDEGVEDADQEANVEDRDRDLQSEITEGTKFTSGKTTSLAAWEVLKYKFPPKKGTQLLAEAPLPRYAQRAQIKNAPFKQPKTTTPAKYQRVQSRSEESPSTSPTSPSWFASREEQKQLRTQKLKELEVKKQQEKEASATTPKRILVQPKVKCTSRNRNQGLMDTMLGVNQDEASNAALFITKAADTNEHRNQEKTVLSDPRLKSTAKVIPRDPNLKKHYIENPPPPPPSVQQSRKESAPSTSAVPNNGIVVRNTSGPSILKPGAQVILSPPNTNNNVHYKESAKPQSLDYGRPRLDFSPYVSEDDIYKRILGWRPVWLQEQKQKNMREDPPIIKDRETLMALMSYESYEAYFNIYYPLLLSELWACIGSDLANRYRDTSHREQNSRYEYKIKIDDIRKDNSFPFVKQIKHKSDKDKGHGDDLIHVRYHTWTPRMFEIDYKKDLVAVTFKGIEKSTGKKTEKEVFGLPCPGSDRYETVYKKQDYDSRLRKGKGTPNEQGYRFSETIVCKVGNNFEVDKSELGNVDRICTITHKLREFRALNLLKSFRLWERIIFPGRGQKFSWEEWKSQTYKAKSHDLISACQQLNLEQQAIVQCVCNKICSPEPELMLMHGPPGTGKTTTIVALVLQLLVMYRKMLPNRNHRILICTPSNAAIDEIMQRLIHAAESLPNASTFFGGQKINILRVGEGYARELHKYSVDGKLEQSELDETTAKSIKAEIEDVNLEIDEIQKTIEDLKAQKNTIALDSKLSQLEELRQTKRSLRKDYENVTSKSKSNKELVQQRRTLIIKSAQIICSTLSASSTSMMKNALVSGRSSSASEDKPFICCIVDEASQTTEPETLLPLSLNISKLLLVGDPHQLGATVLSNSADDKKYGQSLFSRHFQFHNRKNKTCNPVMTLVRQYRMHPDIVSWPNNYFYDGQLQNLYKHPGSNYPLRPYYFLNVSSGREHAEKEGQIQNTDEVLMVKALVDVLHEILHLTKSKWSVGIITPYAAQRHSIRNALQNKIFTSFENLDIDTVDGFQGQEKDIIILSCVRTDGTGFLKSRNRLNVALTRAKHSLYIIGDARCLCQEEMWRCLIKEAAKDNNKYDVHANFMADLKLLHTHLHNNLKIK